MEIIGIIMAFVFILTFIYLLFFSDENYEGVNFAKSEEIERAIQEDEDFGPKIAFFSLILAIALIFALFSFS